MTPAMLWLLFATITAVVCVVALVRRRIERQRTEALGRLAETMGLAFEAKGDVSAVRASGDLQLFERGHSKRVTNLMTGRVGGQQASVFDYRYTTGAGKSQHVHRQTVVLLPSAKPSLPDLHMAPGRFVYKIAEAFGYQDIRFESNPDFSRHYIVRGVDEDAIRTALYPKATSYFAEHEGWTVDVRSGNVGITRSNRRPKPEDMPAFIEDACDAVRHL